MTTLSALQVALAIVWAIRGAWFGGVKRDYARGAYCLLWAVLFVQMAYGDFPSAPIEVPK